MCELCPAPDVYSDVVLTVVDDGNGFQDVEFKGVFSGWALVQGYDDGTNGDETSGDGVWTAVIDSVLGPASYEWGAIENDGSEWGIWLLDYIGLPNQVFTVEEDTEKDAEDYIVHWQRIVDHVRLQPKLIRSPRTEVCPEPFGKD